MINTVWKEPQNRTMPTQRPISPMFGRLPGRQKETDVLFTKILLRSSSV